MRADTSTGKVTSGDDIPVTGDAKRGCRFAATEDTIITPDPDSHPSADTGDLRAIGCGEIRNGLVWRHVLLAQPDEDLVNDGVQSFSVFWLESGEFV